MRQKLYRVIAVWASDNSGFTGIEYGVVGGIIGSALMVGAFAFGDDFNHLMAVLNSYMDSSKELM